jgi:hypothetical protein
MIVPTVPICSECARACNGIPSHRLEIQAPCAVCERPCATEADIRIALGAIQAYAIRCAQAAQIAMGREAPGASQQARPGDLVVPKLQSRGPA